MIARRNCRAFECVVVDINTQWDFCDPRGAFPVTHLRELIPQFRHMIAWTKRNSVPIVSSIESHRPFELSDSGYPIHCVDGSGGQHKLDFTIFPLHAQVEVDNTLSVPIDLFGRYQQVIFCKRTDDLLDNPKADRLLSHLPVREYVLFGTGVECSVKALALALLARGKHVSVVVDACGYWNRSTADLALRQLSAKGARLVTVCDLLSRKLDRRYRYRVTVRLSTSPNGDVGPSAPPSTNGHSHNGHAQSRLPVSPNPAKLNGHNGSSKRINGHGSAT
jgi:nicotinamidase-related amidase